MPWLLNACLLHWIRVWGSFIVRYCLSPQRLYSTGVIMFSANCYSLFYLFLLLFIRYAVLFVFFSTSISPPPHPFLRLLYPAILLFIYFALHVLLILFVLLLVLFSSLLSPPCFFLYLLCLWLVIFIYFFLLVFFLQLFFAAPPRTPPLLRPRPLILPLLHFLSLIHLFIFFLSHPSLHISLLPPSPPRAYPYPSFAASPPPPFIFCS